MTLQMLFLFTMIKLKQHVQVISCIFFNIKLSSFFTLHTIPSIKKLITVPAVLKNQGFTSPNKIITQKRVNPLLLHRIRQP